MKLSSKALAVVIFVIIFGGIVFTTAMNWWQTESSKVPATFSEGEAAGLYNPADIRGSYTFGDIQAAFNVPAADLAAAFAVETQDPGSFAVKELEGLYASAAAEGYEVGTTSIRLFVALYTGLPFELTEDTYLPSPAVDMLLARGGLSTEQVKYLQSHILPDESGAQSKPSATPTQPAEVSGEIESERVIKGKTTFQEVLDWGVSEEVIKAILGTDLPNRLTTVKDFCTENGLDFETIKPALQAEVDKIAP